MKSNPISYGSFVATKPERKFARGHPDYPMSAADLVEFGRSPLRWVKSPEAQPEDPVDMEEVLRCALLAAGELKAHYVARPATYQAVIKICPNCKSESQAKTCKHCGLTRIAVPAEKKWSGSAEFCAKWLQKQEEAGIRALAPDRWDSMADMGKALALDPDARALIEVSAPLAVVHGTWVDPEAATQIPLRETVDLVPSPDTNLATALATIRIVTDCSHIAWAKSAYYSGAHIRAALQQRLFNPGQEPGRNTHAWILVEKQEPHIVARRLASPELIGHGDDTLTALLTAYAKCLRTNHWPAFDLPSPGTLEGFTPVFLEPWMTQGSNPATAFFALDATKATPRE